MISLDPLHYTHVLFRKVRAALPQNISGEPKFDKALDYVAADVTEKLLKDGVIYEAAKVMATCEELSGDSSIQLSWWQRRRVRSVLAASSEGFVYPRPPLLVWIYCLSALVAAVVVAAVVLFVAAHLGSEAFDVGTSLTLPIVTLAYAWLLFMMHANFASRQKRVVQRAEDAEAVIETLSLLRKSAAANTRPEQN